jgi:hypothetical protein
MSQDENDGERKWASERERERTQTERDRDTHRDRARTSKLLILLQVAYNGARAARISGIMSLMEGVILVGEGRVRNCNGLDVTCARG